MKNWGTKKIIRKVDVPAVTAMQFEKLTGQYVQQPHLHPSDFANSLVSTKTEANGERPTMVQTVEEALAADQAITSETTEMEARIGLASEHNAEEHDPEVASDVMVVEALESESPMALPLEPNIDASNVDEPVVTEFSKADYDEAYRKAYEAGEKAAYAVGHEAGYSAGHSAGYTAGETAGREAGYIAGHAEGLAAGKMEGVEKAQADAAQLRTLLGGIEKAVGQYQEALTKPIAAIALAMAEQMVGSALSTEPERIQNVIRKAMNQIPELKPPLRAMLHPDDIPLVKTFVENESTLDLWRFEPDSSIARGGCRLTSGDVEVDMTMPMRWKKIADAIGTEFSEFVSTAQ